MNLPAYPIVKTHRAMQAYRKAVAAGVAVERARLAARKRAERRALIGRALFFATAVALNGAAIGWSFMLFCFD